MHPDSRPRRPQVPHPDPAALSLSHRVLRVLTTLNWILGAGILALLIATFINPEFMTRALGAYGDPPALPAMRAIMILGIVGVPITNAILSRLTRMVESVRRGDPFVVENALRLRNIAWAVLALEICRLIVGVVARTIETPTRPIDIELGFSVTPWLTVLLLFVLSRVFDEGARMREDLEGTV